MFIDFWIPFHDSYFKRRSLKIISCKIMNVTPKIIQKLIRIMKSNAEKTRDGWIPDKNIIFGLLLHHENYR